MAAPDGVPTRARFGAFEVDLQAAELYRHGRRVHLQRQPFLLLAALLERPGELVTRDELRLRLWPADAYVDVEHGLATAMKKLRFALGDSARSPRFIETVGGRGFRFIAPLVPAADGAAAGGSPPTPSASPSRGLMPAVLGAASVLLLVTLALVWALRPATPTARRAEGPVVRLDLLVPSTTEKRLLMIENPGATLRFSPDGSRVMYALYNTNDRTQLVTRDLSALDAQPIDGTRGAVGGFFSPDGDWIGFASGRKLEKVPALGGAPVTLAEAPELHGASWGDDDAIVFAPSGNGGLYRVPSTGGDPVAVTGLDAARSEVSHRWPDVLPHSRAVLFSTVTASHGEAERTIDAVQLATGERRTLLRGVSFARYVENGRLLYARAGSLFTAPFDPDALRITGPETLVPEPVQMDSEGQGLAYFDASRNGTLAYVRRQKVMARLLWVSEHGVVSPASSESRAFATIALSPDGRRVAATLDGDAGVIWIGDLEHDRWSRLEWPGGNPFWLPDGPRLGWSDGERLLAEPPGGAGAPVALPVPAAVAHATARPYTVSRAAGLVSFGVESPTNSWDVWVAPLDGRGEPRPLVQTTGEENEPHFSPDGRWFVDSARASGGDACKVEIRSCSTGTKVWSDLGWQGEWAPDGRRVFYRQGDTLLAAPVTPGSQLSVGAPTALFIASSFRWRNRPRSYAVAPDQKRFLVIAEVGDTPTEVVVVPRWLDDLDARLTREALAESR